MSGALGALLVFYDLSQRFAILAQAGQQSAIDLIFTVPFDWTATEYNLHAAAIVQRIERVPPKR